MIPSLRKTFNEKFTAQKYQQLLKTMEERCGAPMQFRVCETPCFFPKELLDKMARYGKELIQQLDAPQYRRASDAAIPPEFNVPNEAPHPMFVQVDFGLARDAAGRLQPKLVELQGFPSLYAYQSLLSQLYIETFELDSDLRYLYGGLDWQDYQHLLSGAILGGHNPENVILMEIDPLHQKTLPDFLLTEKMVGIPTVAITDVKVDGRELFYEKAGKRIPIRRIYNRAIVDELIRKHLKLHFRFDEELNVEWAGHPNWYFRISKFSLPYLRHECVPKTDFLDRVDRIPDDLLSYVIKPLFSFAGLGVIINPTKKDVAAIPPDQRSQYILQEKINFEPIIETPFGPTKAEIRMMYVWVDELQPVMSIVRMGRGAMMGVDHNKNMEWVGSSAALYPSKV